MLKLMFVLISDNTPGCDMKRKDFPARKELRKKEADARKPRSPVDQLAHLDEHNLVATKERKKLQKKIGALEPGLHDSGVRVPKVGRVQKNKSRSSGKSKS